MKLNTKTTRKGFTLVELLVVMAIIAVLASIATPLILSKRKDADRTKAVGHATQIKLALVEFEDEYGLRPGDSVKDEIDGGESTSANSCFRMLIQGSNTLRSEAIFFAPSKLSKKPDGDVGSKSNNFKQACDKGEVGFLYIDAPFAKSAAPLIAAPLQKEDGSKLDFSAYNGKAVILKVDGSVDTPDIDEDKGEITAKFGGSDINLLAVSGELFGDDAKIKAIEKR